MSRALLDAYSELLAYPGDEFPRRVEASLAAIRAEDPAAADTLAPLTSLLERGVPGEVEELYTRTFDMNPACALELGWHLYGEDYDRGAFLVTVRELMRIHGVEESGELPDHIVHILRLLGRLDQEEAGRFSTRQALPALERILLNFTEEDHPYRAVLVGLRDALASQYGPADQVPASAFACPAPYDDAPIQCAGLPPRPEDSSSRPTDV